MLAFNCLCEENAINTQNCWTRLFLRTSADGQQLTKGNWHVCLPGFKMNYCQKISCLITDHIILYSSCHWNLSEENYIVQYVDHQPSNRKMLHELDRLRAPFLHQKHDMQLIRTVSLAYTSSCKNELINSLALYYSFSSTRITS